MGSIEGYQKYNLIELAEYAIANLIEEDPEFNFWSGHVLCRRDWIIYKVKTQYWRQTHKFGIMITNTAK